MDIFLGRSPIVGAERRLVAWELVLGDATGTSMTGSSEEAGEEASAALLHAATTVDWDPLLCGARLLVAVDRPMLFSDVLDKLPRNRVWLGLGACGEIDGKLAQRLYALHSHRGHRLLLLDYGRRDPREQLLDLTDGVEISVSGPLEERERLVRRAQRRNLFVLGRGIEREVDFISLREEGFGLMQGGCCLEPSGGGETAANAEGRVLLDLLLESTGELEISSVAARIGSNGPLHDGLLRLVNSLELARAQKIDSVSQALMMIGAKGLTRWLNLLLFQVGAVGGSRGPLFRVAATRARLMELLIGDRDGADGKETGEQAFLVGILSLVHVLLGRERSAAIEGLPLSDSLQRALTRHEGELGMLLQLVEGLDAGRLTEVAVLADELEIEPVRLLAHQVEAYEWVLRMIKVDVGG